MSGKRFKLIKGVKLGTHSGIWDNRKQHNMGIGDELWVGEVVDMLNEGVALVEENKELKKENEQLQKETFFLTYWKRKAMILLMQVRRLTPRMTDKEVREFAKELEEDE